MVIEYLKRLTFLTREEIESIEKEHTACPEKRIAQKALAREILNDLHGPGSFEEAVHISEQLFAGDVKNIPVHDLLAGLRNVPHFETEGGVLTDVLVNAGICSSKREAREFIGNGALTVNGETVTDMNLVLNAENAIAGKYIVVRRGKKKYFVGELK